MTNAQPPVRLRRRRGLRACLAALRNRSGVAAVEFALILPVFISLGMLGTEVAYMATVNMQVSQIALALADNASRLGQTDNSAVTPTVTEADIDSIMDGALRQGRSIDLENNGRVILSSLERHPTNGKQYFHWQRCRGSLDRDSTYGDDGNNNGLSSHRIYGVGVGSSQVTAASGSAVMVAEVYYQHTGLFNNVLPVTPVMREEAVFTIRDDRNLTPGVTGSGGDSDC